MAGKVKVPSMDIYLTYDGAHCHNLWASLDHEWRCPACRRTKFEILRWGVRYKRTPEGRRTEYKDWIATLHEHHDHSDGMYNFWGNRFEPEVICGQCNTSDGTAKRVLCLPEDFSFSPTEIGQFVIATPHGNHKHDFGVAQAIYDGLPINKRRQTSKA